MTSNTLFQIGEVAFFASMAALLATNWIVDPIINFCSYYYKRNKGFNMEENYITVRPVKPVTPEEVINHWISYNTMEIDLDTCRKILEAENMNVEFLPTGEIFVMFNNQKIGEIFMHNDEGQYCYSGDKDTLTLKQQYVITSWMFYCNSMNLYKSQP